MGSFQFSTETSHSVHRHAPGHRDTLMFRTMHDPVIAYACAQCSDINGLRWHQAERRQRGMEQAPQTTASMRKRHSK